MSTITTQKIGILLANLGTPKAPTAKAVRPYLRQFLMDPRVIDIPTIPRWLLVNLIIAPFRAPKSAEAYQKIWTEEGSPLLVYSEQLTKQVGEALGEDYAVALGMRYGQPSLESALKQLIDQRVTEIRVLPLYPQYSTSATGSVIAELYRLAQETWDPTRLKILPSFYNHPAYQEALTSVSKPYLEQSQPDHVLFSFHGLPERQIKKSDCSGSHCLQKANCCEKAVVANQNCYRFHCFETARLQAERLGLASDRYSVSFQSRLGRTPWIQPYTDDVIPQLVKQGVKKLAVLCPAFVADCLETIEEIGIRGRELFQEAGGEELVLVACLNSHRGWVKAVSELLR